MDKFIHNFSQLKSDPKGWFVALPLWRKVLLFLSPLGATLWLVSGLVGGVPANVEHEAVERYSRGVSVFLGGTLEDYSISNEYTRKRNGETRYYKEFKFKLSNGRTMTHGAVFQQRGDRWYWEYFDPSKIGD